MKYLVYNFKIVYSVEIYRITTFDIKSQIKHNFPKGKVAEIQPYQQVPQLSMLSAEFPHRQAAKLSAAFGNLYLNGRIDLSLPYSINIL